VRCGASCGWGASARGRRRAHARRLARGDGNELPLTVRRDGDDLRFRGGSRRKRQAALRTDPCSWAENAATHRTRGSVRAQGGLGPRALLRRASSGSLGPEVLAARPAQSPASLGGGVIACAETITAAAQLSTNWYPGFFGSQQDVRPWQSEVVARPPPRRAGFSMSAAARASLLASARR
jgi:hypothetical protein